MKETIRQIIDMDKEARRLTDEARERRAGSAKAIEQKKHEVSENYLSMARKRVDDIRQSEMTDAQAQWEEMEKQYERIAQRLNDSYMTRREQWVSGIVERVISGDD